MNPSLKITNDELLDKFKTQKQNIDFMNYEKKKEIIINYCNFVKDQDLKQKIIDYIHIFFLEGFIKNPESFLATTTSLVGFFGIIRFYRDFDDILKKTFFDKNYKSIPYYKIYKMFSSWYNNLYESIKNSNNTFKGITGFEHLENLNKEGEEGEEGEEENVLFI